VLTDKQMDDRLARLRRRLRIALTRIDQAEDDLKELATHLEAMRLERDEYRRRWMQP
jgi:chromosome segregation ATPase